MAQRTKAQLNTAVLAILDDTGGAIFTDTSTALVEALTDFSRERPYEVEHWMTATDKSREISTAGLVDLIEPMFAIYPILLKNTDGKAIDDEDLSYNRRNIEWEGDIVRMSLSSAPIAGATDSLTGTVTTTASSTAVSGSGTAFTTELRAGYSIYIGSNWYRVASISSDTALVLEANVASADAGTDTSMSYWRADVILKCHKKHFLAAQIDLAGAIDNTGGYAEGVWTIHIDGLGTGTMAVNTPFTIAGVPGLYRITADATIATSEADIVFEPALKGRVADGALVTFKPSSLNPQEETWLTELAAAQIAINFVGNGRTAINNATTILDLINTTVDLVTAELTAANTDIASGRTEAAKVAAIITSAATELALVNEEVDQAIADLDSGRSLINTVTVGADADGQFAQYAQTGLANAQGFITSGIGYLRQANADESIANTYTGLAAAEFNNAAMLLRQAGSYANEMNSRISVSAAVADMSSWGWNKYNAVMERIRISQTVRVTHKYSED